MGRTEYADNYQGRVFLGLAKLLGVAAIVFILHCTVMLAYGLQDSYRQSDVGVVFGNEVHADGRISQRLQDRLDKCIELYQQGWFSTVIVSGGIDGFGNDEARRMQGYLQERGGIPTSAIVVDSRGENTRATVKFTKAYLDSHAGHSAICISQYSHLLRSDLAMRRIGVEQVGHAHAITAGKAWISSPFPGSLSPSMPTCSNEPQGALQCVNCLSACS